MDRKRHPLTSEIPEEEGVWKSLFFVLCSGAVLEYQCHLSFRVVIRSAGHTCQQKHSLGGFCGIRIRILVVVVDDFPNAALNDRLGTFIAGEQGNIQTAPL